MQHVELETIKLTVEGKDLYFPPARRLSEDLALTIVVDPMLVAWFDGKKAGNTQKCQKVSTSWGGWLTLKDMGHGGRVRIDVNDAEYSFIFAEAAAD